MSLSTKGISRCFFHHVLLALTFLINDNPKEKVYIDHINGKRDDNSLSNLRFVTASENNRNRKNSRKENIYYIKRKIKTGPIIETIPSYSLSTKVKHKISTSINRGYKYEGFYWEKINKEVEIRLKELKIKKEDLKFIKNERYPGVEFSKEGILKTRYGLTLGTLNGSYYMVSSNGHDYLVHRLIYETFSRIQLTSSDILDHKNTNSLDNRFINLKLGTQKENMNNPKTIEKRSKKVIQMDLSGNIIREFSSIKNAEVFLRIDNSSQSISSCCKGKQKTAYGYKWEYADKQLDKDDNNKNN